MLRVDINLLFTVINVLILFVLLKKFLFKPVNEILKKRQDEVDKIIADANAEKKEAEDLKMACSTAMSRLEEQKEEKIAEARTEASAAYDRIIKQAEDEARVILDDARVDAENEKKKIIKSAQDEIADMVIDATMKVIGEKATEKNDSALYDEFLVKAGELDETSNQ